MLSLLKAQSERKIVEIKPKMRLEPISGALALSLSVSLLSGLPPARLSGARGSGSYTTV